jgi:hypothetical protein
MTSLSFNAVVETLGFGEALYAPQKVIVARHASVAHSFITRDIEAFEEYQRFQTSNSFGKCEYILAFIGLPGEGDDATFAGVYKVLARSRRGEPGFREPTGDAEVVASCAGQNHFYGLTRQKEFDFLQFTWDIRWNIPGPAKYQYMRKDFPLEVLRFDGCKSIVDLKELLLKRSSVIDTTDEILEGSAGYVEGAQYYATHLFRERNSALVKEVKDRAKIKGTYGCEVCKADFQKLYGIDYLECHHAIPVSTLPQEAATKIEDMILLCANCHRAVHRRKPWLDKSEIHKLLISHKVVA